MTLTTAVPHPGLPRPDALPPLVVACLRFTDLRPEVDPLSGAVLRDARGAGFSAGDQAALEHALRVAQAWSGRVLVVCAGPPAADAALREVAALGSPRLPVEVRRVQAPGGGTGAHPGADPLGSAHDYLHDLVADEQALAHDLASAIRDVGDAALVVCGDRSSDRGTGALPALLAHALGAAQALGLVELHVESETDGSDGAGVGVGSSTSSSSTSREAGAVLGLRRLDGGRRERLRLPRPTVCSVEAAGIRLRRAALPALLAANRTQAPVVVAPARRPGSASVSLGAVRPFRPRPAVVPPPTGSPRDRLLTLTGATVAHDPPTVVGPVDAAEAADALLAYLRRNGYLT